MSVVQFSTLNNNEMDGILKNKIAVLREKLTGGVAPAIVTPLLPGSYAVDTAVIPQLVDFLIDRDVKGVFIGGTTGEGPFLDIEARQQLAEAAVSAVNGRIVTILHIGGMRTETAVSLARHAATLGVDAIAAVTPFYYGMHDDGLAAYFHAVADAAPGIPLFLYEIPHMAVNGISPGLAARLSVEIPSLAGVKCSNQSVQAVRRLLDALPPEKFVLIGNETAALGSLALGCVGMVSGLSTAVPEPFVGLAKAFAAGDMDEARRQQHIINQLLLHMPPGARIGGIKAILGSRGVAVGTAVPTLPMPDASPWPAMQDLIV